MIETFTKQGMTKFSQIPDYLDREGRAISFETRSGAWLVPSLKHEADSQDTAIFVVDILQESDLLHGNILSDQINMVATHCRRVLVAVNKMCATALRYFDDSQLIFCRDEVDWSRKRYLHFVNILNQVFVDHAKLSRGVHILYTFSSC
jgi:hypothetical protein